MSTRVTIDLAGAPAARACTMLACAVAAGDPADHEFEVAERIKAAIDHADAGAMAAQLAVPLVYRGL